MVLLVTKHVYKVLKITNRCSVRAACSILFEQVRNKLLTTCSGISLMLLFDLLQDCSDNLVTTWPEM